MTPHAAPAEVPPPAMRAVPECPAFGTCGGCAYQDLAYEEELRVKGRVLRDALRAKNDIPDAAFDAVVASPQPYHYRSRLDLALLRTKDGRVTIGFMPENRWHVIPVDSCAIAREEISSFLPELRRLAAEKLPPGYRTASLVVKCGDDGRVRWGGAGRHSLRLAPEDYLWTEVDGKRIHYSLDTFFQANLSILPLVCARVAEDVPEGAAFFDLYAGTGLFGIAMSGRARRVVMIEDTKPSVEVARHNVARLGLEARVAIDEGKVERALPARLEESRGETRVVFVDPPRRGLSATAAAAIGGADAEALLYLSCSPESLARDLASLVKHGWRAQRVTPFDFFPKTRHLETLVTLRKE